MKKLPYKEGDWFAVPLGNDRYGVGVIARAAPRGKILLGYFFDRFFQGIPQLSRLEDLTPDKAIEVVRFGDLSLFNREWRSMSAETRSQRRLGASNIRTEIRARRSARFGYRTRQQHSGGIRRLGLGRSK